MPDRNDPDEKLLDVLKERAKELNCLYRIDEILKNDGTPLAGILEQIVSELPAGFRFPDVCQTRIVFENHTYQTSEFSTSPLFESTDIKADGKTVGTIHVAYTQDVPAQQEGAFLDKERKLIKTVADRIGQAILYRRMLKAASELRSSARRLSEHGGYHPEWKVIIGLLEKTDPDMLQIVCRKMVNFLCGNAVTVPDGQSGVPGAIAAPFHTGEVNTPGEKAPPEHPRQFCQRVFALAAEHISDVEISMRVQSWIQDEKAYSLIKTIGRTDVTLSEIIDAISRYNSMVERDGRSVLRSERWLEVALIRRFLSDNLDFIRVARPSLRIADFYDITTRLIYPVGSHGKIGGKATGLFVAQKLISTMSNEIPLLGAVKTPRTWYIATDAAKEFLQFNNLHAMNEQKYKDLDEIRLDYPNIIQLLKSAQFPVHMVKSLSLALDDFGDNPLIVRSSSLLEDQVGAAFSGKYKSLFLCNQGSKKQRMEALMDAIAEIYASIYSPDSIQYRIERGMLDFYEEMGIVIQEVVGTRIGPYFMPLYAGVAFSNNEFRWSPRLKREDGLIRMVLGLGTRAVDRLNDDFPILISPGQPRLRANSVPEEVKWYSPRKSDVLNLETNAFESIDIAPFLREFGECIPGIQNIVSTYRHDYIGKPRAFDIDFAKDDLVVTFEGLASDSPFVPTIAKMLEVLKEKLQTPVDIEFASDGTDLYLLQCRSQSSREQSAPCPIPRDIQEKSVVFSAKRHVSNGKITDISHIVYVDPDGYNALQRLEDLQAVGRAVGALNSMLPKRRFILMGPGRWGSRGDIKLGVQTSYADINNTAALIEIAQKRSHYVPELSFGTHFFQDLVEADIRYLPLYPDDEGILFSRSFLTGSPNILPALLPDFARLGDVVRVIDIPEATDGNVLHISMNGDIGEALGFLARHSGENIPLLSEIRTSVRATTDSDIRFDDNFWRWRSYMAERIATKLDYNRYGIKGVYLFGSVNAGNAGPCSDIDIIVHFQGSEEQRDKLILWLSGWSMALAEINYLRTGYVSEGLLDVHIITDDDIAKKTVFASKIGAITDPASRLRNDEGAS